MSSLSPAIPPRYSFQNLLGDDNIWSWSSFNTFLFCENEVLLDLPEDLKCDVSTLEYLDMLNSSVHFSPVSVCGWRQSRK